MLTVMCCKYILQNITYVDSHVLQIHSAKYHYVDSHVLQIHSAKYHYVDSHVLQIHSAKYNIC